MSVPNKLYLSFFPPDQHDLSIKKDKMPFPSFSDVVIPKLL